MDNDYDILGLCWANTANDNDELYLDWDNIDNDKLGFCLASMGIG